MPFYTFLLAEGEKVELEVHPDSIITENYSLEDGSIIYVVIDESEQQKLLALQEIINEGVAA